MELKALTERRLVGETQFQRHLLHIYILLFIKHPLCFQDNMLHDKVRKNNQDKNGTLDVKDMLTIYKKMAELDFILRKGGDEEVVLQNIVCLVREYEL